jgi:tetratricopeptide (TPR) repeat protein
MSVIQYDCDELFFLALKAMETGNHERAFELLKEGVRREDSSRFNYMLGAMYAELRMFSKAIDHINRALEIDPSLRPAAFQLGLLHAVSGNDEQARKAWSSLDRLSEDDELVAYRDALVDYMDGNRLQAIDKMQNALLGPKSNVPLMNDMQAILNGWIKSDQTLPEDGTTEKDSSVESGHYFLSAYKKREH